MQEQKSSQEGVQRKGVSAEHKFKILKYMGMFVDVSRLTDGIYESATPHIYQGSKTMEDMIMGGRMVNDISGNCFLPESYFENLSKCTLENYILIQEQCAHSPVEKYLDKEVLDMNVWVEVAADFDEDWNLVGTDGDNPPKFLKQTTLSELIFKQ